MATWQHIKGLFSPATRRQKKTEGKSLRLNSKGVRTERRLNSRPWQVGFFKARIPVAKKNPKNQKPKTKTKNKQTKQTLRFVIRTSEAMHRKHSQLPRLSQNLCVCRNGQLFFIKIRVPFLLEGNVKCKGSIF